VTDTPIAAVVMAAGLGTRMRSAVPKHLHPLLGRRMVDWVVLAAREAGVGRVVIVCSDAAEGELAAEGIETAVQAEPRGTGDAVAAAHGVLGGFEGDVLVLNGDVPGIRAELLLELVDTHRVATADATVLTFEPPDPRRYGRVVRDAEGGVAKIVEAGDASEDELAVAEVNSGMYVFRADRLWPALERLESRNAQGELYITDTVGLLVGDGGRVAAHLAPDPFEVEGVNTREELAFAGAALRDRINRGHMLAGVTIIDPATTWIEPDVRIEADVTIHPFVVLRGRTSVAALAEIHPNTVVVDAEIQSGAAVGPFCYLRPGTVLEADSKAGTFVEIKNSRIGPRAKVPHLSYMGDAEIGEGTNIGAGAITANFAHKPGEPKRNTRIGKNVRTGIHNAFVAPVELGDGAWIAAGSVITEDVPPDALAIARARQENKEGYAARQRDDD
jgi:bifunctional UDP-N-acetylglucosamine pyrophosphorylase/glucosamine-1-phosphate N-acetyltransferase